MDLNALREFAAIATEGSFAGAARRLGTPKSTVSKRIQDLEAALGVQLIERTTRRLKLTQEGTLVLARADRILSDADEIRDALAGQDAEVRGHLRIAAPTLLGDIFLGKIVAVCRRLYPALTLEIVLSDGQPDMAQEGFDGAIRLGHSDDNRYVSVPLATTRQVCVAAPDIIAKPLVHPQDLGSLPILMFGVGLIQTWRFSKNGQATSVRLAAGVSLTSHHALRSAAIGGAGVALLPLFLVERDIEHGHLVPVLEGWSQPETEVTFIYADAHSLSARLRAFQRVLTEAFGNGTLHGSVLNL